MLLYIIFLVTFFLITIAQAATTFVGCVLTTEVMITGTNGGYVTSQNACNNRCLNGGYQYSYYTGGQVPTVNNCYCDHLNSYVAASAYAAGSSASACIASGLQAVATDLSTTFGFNGCVGTIVGVTVNLQQGTILGGYLVSEPQTCFQRCRGNLIAYVIPIVPSVTAIAPSYGCVCDPSGQVTTGLCGVGQFYGFIHSASASAAGQARKRQEKVLKAQDERRRKSFCPKNMKACIIPGVDNSWECIDPDSELESCGGCKYGEYTSTGELNRTATGIDCSSHPGAALGGATCINGKCDIQLCKRKWKLMSGGCVRGKETTAQVLAI
ncbi:uncharacterized protein L201_002162 [Kwoniella dendrophila CBS 6074]|uniref:Protein CPL1-like domain-containing protein n=1 Tax=Kwoniella dendrophila CBS 6074 TaxID=1295534 RepID=A0AAX4JQZ1_9TREE